MIKFKICNYYNCSSIDSRWYSLGSSTSSQTGAMPAGQGLGW